MASQAARAVQTAHDPRWAQVQARDASADGTFVYAVETTGVYCRPSCASRPKRPENVSFYGSSSEAERAGYRACKRCTPNDASSQARRTELVQKLCRFIERSEEPVTLEQLASESGLSAFHTQRLFKAITGVTPRSYAAAKRRERVRDELKQSKTVTQAIYGAGYGSNGRFYSESHDALGMTPTRFREGGTHERISFALGQCSLGAILVAATARGVCAILLGAEPEPLLHDLQQRFPRAQLVGGDPSFEQLVANVVGLVEQPQQEVMLPLDVRGTAFQQRVWQALRTIPSGKTWTYTQLAEAIGAPKAVRAVASACAANALAVAIPCHRVVRIGGDLSGYRWGIERKRALLDREAKR